MGTFSKIIRSFGASGSAGGAAQTCGTTRRRAPNRASVAPEGLAPRSAPSSPTRTLGELLWDENAEQREARLAQRLADQAEPGLTRHQLQVAMEHLVRHGGDDGGYRDAAQASGISQGVLELLLNARGELQVRPDKLEGLLTLDAQGRRGGTGAAPGAGVARPKTSVLPNVLRHQLDRLTASHERMGAKDLTTDQLHQRLASPLTSGREKRAAYRELRRRGQQPLEADSPLHPTHPQATQPHSAVSEGAANLGESGHSVGPVFDRSPSNASSHGDLLDAVDALHALLPGSPPSASLRMASPSPTAPHPSSAVAPGPEADGRSGPRMSPEQWLHHAPPDQVNRAEQRLRSSPPGTAMASVAAEVGINPAVLALLLEPSGELRDTPEADAWLQARLDAVRSPTSDEAMHPRSPSPANPMASSAHEHIALDMTAAPFVGNASRQDAGSELALSTAVSSHALPGARAAASTMPAVRTMSERLLPTVADLFGGVGQVPPDVRQRLEDNMGVLHSRGFDTPEKVQQLLKAAWRHDAPIAIGGMGLTGNAGYAAGMTAASERLVAMLPPHILRNPALTGMIVGLGVGGLDVVISVIGKAAMTPLLYNGADGNEHLPVSVKLPSGVESIMNSMKLGAASNFSKNFPRVLAPGIQALFESKLDGVRDGSISRLISDRTDVALDSHLGFAASSYVQFKSLLGTTGYDARLLLRGDLGAVLDKMGRGRGDSFAESVKGVRSALSQPAVPLAVTATVGLFITELFAANSAIDSAGHAPGSSHGHLPADRADWSVMTGKRASSVAIMALMIGTIEFLAPMFAKGAQSLGTAARGAAGPTTGAAARAIEALAAGADSALSFVNGARGKLPDIGAWLTNRMAQVAPTESGLSHDIESQSASTSPALEATSHENRAL